MNVLFLADGFTHGGLETHIAQLCRVLLDSEHKPFLAHGLEENKNLHTIFNKVIPNLSLSFDSNRRELVKTIKKLERFIIDNKIDILHAHPFYSLFVGAIIANRRKLPLLCTLHGPFSVDGAPGPNPSALWRSLISKSHVIAISGELGAQLYKKYNHWPDIQPNFVDLKQVKLEPHSQTMLWSGRLDADKVPGLLRLLDLLELLPNWRLDIAGAGAEQDAVVQRISASSTLNGRVKFLGWIDDIASLMRFYEIIAGMGRVVVEASQLSIPCLLVGYDSVMGLVTPQMADAAAFTNFSGRLTKPERISTIASYIDAGLHSDYGVTMKSWAEKNRSKDRLGQRYLSVMSNAATFRSSKFTRFYKEILSVSDSDALIWYDERFHVDM